MESRCWGTRGGFPRGFAGGLREELAGGTWCPLSWLHYQHALWQDLGIFLREGCYGNTRFLSTALLLASSSAL